MFQRVAIIIFSTKYNGIILIEPPKKINRSYYCCGKKFHLDPILEMYKISTCFGIALISGNKSICYKITLSGANVDISIIKNTSVKLQKRQKKGGQSAQRIGRIRQEKENVYVNKVVDMVVSSYMNYEKTKCNIKGIIIAGPASLKYKVVDHNKVQKYLGNKILKVINISEIKKSSGLEIYKKYSEMFIDAIDKETITVIEEVKNLILNFNSNSSNTVIYGYENLMYNIKQLKYILVYSTIDNNIKQIIKKNKSKKCKIYEIKPKYQHMVIIDIIGIKWY
uniref:Peptide chain release factor 1 n=1 Tax=Mimivirus LCMiAC02 TaxID=2506609 RepID=A0A4D5XEW8_9VIRU|nr:MAG: peptide chain release factor 1 [Mimivirus LCMiAC02]